MEEPAQSNERLFDLHTGGYLSMDQGRIARYKANMKGKFFTRPWCPLFGGKITYGADAQGENEVALQTRSAFQVLI